jgi:hypothetical protein
MRIFSAPALDKPLDRRRAWVCVAVNQLAFPGLGTIMAGRRTGFPQAAMMLLGFFIAMGFMLWFIFCALRGLSVGWSEDQFHAAYRPYLWAGETGLALCLAAWGWALVSSVGILRETKGHAKLAGG